MKILQVAALYYPHVGGIENYVQQISRRLVERGHDVTIYTLNIPRTNKYEIIDGIKIHRFNARFSLLNNHFSFQMLTELMKKNDYDIIHAHGYLQFTTNYSIISAFKAKTPLIITSHGSIDYEDWKKYVSILYHKSLGLWTLSKASSVIALSPSQYKIVESYGAKNITIIPNGIDIQDIKFESDCNEIRKEYGLNKETIILFVGSIIARKGIEYLIDAMKFINSNAVLLIVGGTLKGEENYKEKIDKKIKEENIKNVIFTGRINKKMLREAYNIADIFVLPSFAEGLPTVLLEAMAYKKAIVASDIPGNSDLIQNGYNGILFRPKDSNELSNRINELIANPNKRKTLGINAFNSISANYSWDQITRNIEKLYNEKRNGFDKV